MGLKGLGKRVEELEKGMETLINVISSIMTKGSEQNK